jgi:hypothetical protein
MSGTLLPSNDMVAVAWLKTNVTYLDNQVATSLPKEYAGWAGKGFVVVNAFGGNTDNMLGVRKPVLSLTYYAKAAESGKPPWSKANQLAEQVRALVIPTGVPLATTRGGYRLNALGTNYKDALVQNIFWRSEPRRRPGDNADFAVYTNDVEIHWVVVP